MSKIEFKSFVRRHPELANATINKDITWQKLYEIYEMYGENSNVWDEYLGNNKKTATTNTNISSTVGNFINTIKGVDMDTVQKGIENIQKTIGLLQDIGIGTATKEPVRPYEPRPLYRYFDD